MFRRQQNEKQNIVAPWGEYTNGDLSRTPFICDEMDSVTSTPLPTTTSTHLDLTRVPMLECHWNQCPTSSVFKNDPEGVAAVQFRLMQRRLSNLFLDGGILLITSPACGDGKSFTARNLAWAFAEAGGQTLLLDMDLRRPAQALQLGASPLFGTDDILSGRAKPRDVVRRIDNLPLGCIALSHHPLDPIHLLRSPHMSHLLRWARQSFTWVVMDAPPVLPVADVGELLPHVDMVALVVRQRVTANRLVEKAAERLDNRLSFMILNETTLSPADGYRYD